MLAQEIGEARRIGPVLAEPRFFESSPAGRIEDALGDLPQRSGARWQATANRRTRTPSSVVCARRELVAPAAAIRRAGGKSDGDVVVAARRRATAAMSSDPPAIAAAEAVDHEAIFNAGSVPRREPARSRGELFDAGGEHAVSRRCRRKLSRLSTSQRAPAAAGAAASRRRCRGRSPADGWRTLRPACRGAHSSSSGSTSGRRTACSLRSTARRSTASTSANSSGSL